MSKPVRFTPYCWAKLCFIRDIGNSEIGCFGMAETDDPLLLTDIHLPKQDCTTATVELDGQSLLDYRADCRRNGLSEKHSFRVWIHTHPAMSAKPSGTDETTYAELFTGADWGIMLILSKTEDTYARVRYGGDGPQADAILDIEIDYGATFAASDQDAWEAEYWSAVTIKTYTRTATTGVWKQGRKQKYVDGKWVDDTNNATEKWVGNTWVPDKAVTPASEILATFPPAIGTGWQGAAKARQASAEAESEAESEAVALFNAKRDSRIRIEDALQADADALQADADADADAAEYFIDGDGDWQRDDGTPVVDRMIGIGTEDAGRVYEIRIMWCYACGKSSEICDLLDKPDADDADECLHCESNDIYETSNYQTTV